MKTILSLSIFSGYEYSNVINIDESVFTCAIFRNKITWSLLHLLLIKMLHVKLGFKVSLNLMARSIFFIAHPSIENGYTCTCYFNFSSIYIPVHHRVCTQLFPVCSSQEVASLLEHKEHHPQEIRWKIQGYLWGDLCSVSLFLFSLLNTMDAIHF